MAVKPNLAMIIYIITSWQYKMNSSHKIITLHFNLAFHFLFYLQLDFVSKNLPILRFERNPRILKIHLV